MRGAGQPGLDTLADGNTGRKTITFHLGRNLLSPSLQGRWLSKPSVISVCFGSRAGAVAAKCMPSSIHLSVKCAVGSPPPLHKKKIMCKWVTGNGGDVGGCRHLGLR